MATDTPQGFLFKGPPNPPFPPKGPAQQRIQDSGILIWMQFSSVLPLTGLRTHSSVFQRRADRAILQAGSCQDDWHLTPLLPSISFSLFQSEQLGASERGLRFPALFLWSCPN